MPDKITYLNTAACGLLEPATIAAANKFYTSLSTNASTSSEHWRANDEPRIRQAIASFIGANAQNIAMIPNFSWALNGTVQSLKGTERVMLYRHDYPSLTEPFKINKFDIQWIDDEDGFTLPIAQMEQQIKSGNIDLLAISHVQYNTGYKLDIERIGALCKEHGIWFIVDTTQSQGAIPINIATQHMDVLIGSNYKWMNAGFGTGIMYMSDRFLEQYPPVVGGNNSFKNSNGTMMYVPSVQSFEPGHPNMSGLSVLETAIAHKLQLGVGNIEKHNMQLTAQLLVGIKNLKLQLVGPYDTHHRTSILILKDKDGLSDWIKQHDIVVTNRGGIVRISMHYYNTEADVAQLVACLQGKFA